MDDIKPAAFMTHVEDRAITQRELDSIPGKARQELCARMYGVPLYTESNYRERMKRQTDEINRRKMAVDLPDLIEQGWRFEYEPATSYVIARHPSGGLRSVCDVSPVWGPAIASALNLIIPTTTHRDALVAALTPSTETKGAYLGEFGWKEPITEEIDGEPYTGTAIYEVPWDTVKDIMKAIRLQAELMTPSMPMHLEVEKISRWKKFKGWVKRLDDYLPF